MNAIGLIQGEITKRWEAVSPHDVVVNDRQRRLDPHHVRAVRDSFEQLGGRLQLQPIVLSDEGTHLELVDGLHRLQAAIEEDWEFLGAEIYTGLTDADKKLLEAETNRVRKQLSPVELEEAWKTYYEPAFKARAKQNQLANLRQGDEVPVPVNSGNGNDTGPVVMPEKAKEATGLSLDTLNKITDIRTIAHAEGAPEELRAAALRGLERLSRPGASVDTVHKSLLKLQERTQRQPEDPNEARRQRLEQILDRMVNETTLLAERLDGDLGADLLDASTESQVAAESLRAVRVAVTHALATLIAIECKPAEDASAELGKLGGEVTRMLSERTTAALNLEVDHG